ncbi:uncharacterized protein UV8b_04264 [Ustilaginoidea virens]|uniref:Uncharacterized protein n=1 Tax=Ustilaginoidea virens TaxID=1159556 RepID=A0A8E5HR94_USTVR|nr:uncharacterized protein UV8b_04264 [Ustilaginoidea virens]QUC20023.1 hypothetical protein UV8b_04264 [Ustilaginoidea virens]
MDRWIPMTFTPTCPVNSSIAGRDAPASGLPELLMRVWWLTPEVRLRRFVFFGSSSAVRLLRFVNLGSSSPVRLLRFVFSGSSSPVRLLRFVFVGSSSSVRLLRFVNLGSSTSCLSYALRPL